ncbi:MAG: L,D-transpeptidase family protein [Flavobacteriales bacterium]|nr:L,D-transpeptidase family protein [Flavobacteriales bacterium]
MMMQRTALPIALLAFGLHACAQDPPGSDAAAIAAAASLSELPATRPLRQLIDSLGIDPKDIRFHVAKSKRRFTVLAHDSALKSYPCVLGEVPMGDKFHQGDRRTPEGTFTFRSKRVHAQWHKFIWVDYPNAESWRRYHARRRDGVIPAHAGVGGEIGVHGVPDGMDHWIDAGMDWTWGCIALRNADVDEVYPFIIPNKTMMTVMP